VQNVDNESIHETNTKEAISNIKEEKVSAKKSIIEKEEELNSQEKYKGFHYKFPDEESKRRFEDFTEYNKMTKAISMHHDSIFKIKNYFVRRNFLKRKAQVQAADSMKIEKKISNLTEAEKNELIEREIDLTKEKVLLYETNTNILELVRNERRTTIFIGLTAIINNLLVLTSFEYLFIRTWLCYINSYLINPIFLQNYLCYSKIVKDWVLQAEYNHKTKELILLKRKPFSFKLYEEKLTISDLTHHRSKRLYEKSNHYLVNTKNGSKNAFHENGIWHKEKVFDLIFDVKS
jgi:hypothetical protein